MQQRLNLCALIRENINILTAILKTNSVVKTKAFCCIYDSQERSSFMSWIIYCILRNILESNWSLKSSRNVRQFSVVCHKVVH